MAILPLAVGHVDETDNNVEVSSSSPACWIGIDERMAVDTLANNQKQKLGDEGKDSDRAANWEIANLEAN